MFDSNVLKHQYHEKKHYTEDLAFVYLMQNYKRYFWGQKQALKTYGMPITTSYLAWKTKYDA